MLDIPSISAISAVVAAVGVMIGVIFAVLELRNLVKTRQTDLVIGLHLTWTSKDGKINLHDIPYIFEC